MLPSDLYIRFPHKKYISFADEWTKAELVALYARVFKYFFYLVIKDIIENKITFKFPPGTRAWLEMVPITGEAFAEARQNGAFADVDFLASNFTGYNLNLRFTNRYGKWYKRIYVSAKYRDMITDMTNAGETW
jgi:hypothetical protein